MKTRALLLLVLLVATPLALAEKGGHGPDAVEWGKVEWRRDFDETVAASKRSGKPIFLLFQEVPG